jgi:hypothetical protein
MVRSRSNSWWWAAVLSGLFGFPLLGSWWVRGGLPPEFDVFSLPHETAPKPGLSTFFLVGGTFLALGMTAFVVLPGWFGFRTAATPRRTLRGPLPFWFWLGLPVGIAGWAAMWFGSGPIAWFSFMPLWGGFISMVDACVYRRTGGWSLLSREPRSLLVLALISVPAWCYFEFLNHFALGFWLYPSDHILPPALAMAWNFVTFTTVWPTLFEWYTLLASSARLGQRWAAGPRLGLAGHGTSVLLAAGCLSLFLFAVFPFQLFIFFWVGPLLVLAAGLGKMGVWTPFRDIQRGDWSAFVLMALSGVINGFFWEFWNYGTVYFQDPSRTNPNYWKYSVPYVDTLHLFSEMPLLGYFGYVPFGAIAWLVWVVAAHFLKLEPALTPPVPGVQPPSPSVPND